jgi:hypothetical protein
MRVIAGCAGLMVSAWVLGGCASQWKIQGGPKECLEMCRNWDMELSGMVGVGNQDATGPGATACVCQVRRAAGGATPNDLAASGTSASTSAAIVALEEAQRQQQQQQAQSTK